MLHAKNLILLLSLSATLSCFGIPFANTLVKGTAAAIISLSPAIATIKKTDSIETIAKKMSKGAVVAGTVVGTIAVATRSPRALISLSSSVLGGSLADLLLQAEKHGKIIHPPLQQSWNMYKGFLNGGKKTQISSVNPPMSLKTTVNTFVNNHVTNKHVRTGIEKTFNTGEEAIKRVGEIYNGIPEFVNSALELPKPAPKPEVVYVEKCPTEVTQFEKMMAKAEEQKKSEELDQQLKEDSTKRNDINKTR